MNTKRRGKKIFGRRDLERMILIMLLTFFLSIMFLVIDSIGFRFVWFEIAAIYTAIGFTRYLTARDDGL